jgi:hypothetical protein
MFALGSLAGYSAISDLKRLMLACVSAVAVLGILHLTLGIDFAPPRGVLLMDHFLSVVALYDCHSGTCAGLRTDHAKPIRQKMGRTPLRRNQVGTVGRAHVSGMTGKVRKTICL